ncbi:hypothetical protein Ahy_A03g012084 [Arachis hypogaea]|uniref:Uncharacterized protein n=1 Tax=Arachis hypogaea TaxID=3818 RepID=A0A445DSP5_ARAHY|nr:hypothetical protein Ahy_A03g012084 [Arachis hypogaea]
MHVAGLGLKKSQSFGSLVCDSNSIGVQTENYGIQFYSLLDNRGVYESVATSESLSMGDLSIANSASVGSMACSSDGSDTVANMVYGHDS